MQKKRNYKFKPYDELTFTDSFMFYATMQNEEICKGVIERLLGIKVRKFNYINGEQTFNPAYDAKSVRLDVYAEDSKRVFDIEVQTYNENEVGKRLRYYQSIIDIIFVNFKPTLRATKIIVHLSDRTAHHRRGLHIHSIFFSNLIFIFFQNSFSRNFYFFVVTSKNLVYGFFFHLWSAKTYEWHKN